MNESLDRVETEQKPEPGRLRKEKKAKKPKTGRQYISRMAWAKAIAYVLMLIFFAALVLGVFEALLSYDHLWRFSSAGEFTATLDDELGTEAISRSEYEYAVGLMRIIYNLSSWAVPLIIAGALGLIACAAFLMCGAGRRNGRDDVVPLVLDKIPLDVYAAICCALGVLIIVAYVYALVPITYGMFVYSEPAVIFVVSSCVIWYIAYVVALAPFLSLATRVKLGGGIWWHNTLICWVCRLCWRAVKWCWSLVKRFCGWIWYMTRKIPIVPRTALIAGIAIVLELFFCALAFGYGYYDGLAVLAAIVYNVALFVALCFGAWQMKSLKAAGERMARGEIDEKIDTQHMYWEFKHHAENLNSIGDGMAAAVEQRMKSERLKTELITNVSHDIKTPLTSIVNYVDLLQKPHTPEQESEYLEVLERQSKRLKKLTEDLVEASKASTGNMNVNIVSTSSRELIEQSLAEYGARMEQGMLTVITNIPDPAPRAMADGRLLWRVLDNLFNNVVKYAMPNTRVYIDAAADGGEVIISVKNISRDPLNISADELMERFVRGDSSRHTEGSGLGLNIVQSLITLMHGKFSLSVDGDLFKAEIRLPEAK